MAGHQRDGLLSFKRQNSTPCIIITHQLMQVAMSALPNMSEELKDKKQRTSDLTGCFRFVCHRTRREPSEENTVFVVSR